ncbi:hypothetical protein ACFOVU_10640 [Nocardiopsis sediminis]|uniref:Uncharacterized protein n=1 Tax=Nocardiopsis sediminis TaxID=1778267 RepID=A0ABV8FP27_9ACTN
MSRPAGAAHPWSYLLGRGPAARPPGPPRFADTARRTLAETGVRGSRAAASAPLRPSRARGRAAEPDWAALRRHATAVRERALAGLERHLTEFEKRAEEAGVHGDTSHIKVEE